MKLFKLVCSVFSIFLFLSCTDEYQSDEEQYDPDVINCSVHVIEKENTRGIPIISADDANFKSIGLMGYYTEQLYADTQNPTSSFFPNKQITKNSSDKWTLDKTYYWPQTGYISFFAYAPYANATNGITITNTQTGAPKLSYTVPQEVAQQPDLMISTPKMDLFKEVVDLGFSHALACVSFDVSGPNVPIEYIGVKGIYTSGTLSMDMLNKEPKWSGLTDFATSLYKVGLVQNPVASDPSTTIMATDGYLMMLPQALGTDAAIVVKFEGIDEKTIPFANLNNKEWLAGYKYNYSLKEGVYDFVVTPGTVSCPYSGSDLTFNFTSTYKKANNQVEDMGWTASILTTSSNETYWTDLFTNLGDASGTDKTKTVAINPSTFTIASSNTIDANLKSATVYDRANIHDLSNSNGTITTANTYVANAAGWFKIPCSVMGNAIKGGSDAITPNNTECINTPGTPFVDYKGNSITTVNNLKLNITNPTVEVLWSDVPGLVTQVQLSADKQYIEFYIAPQCIRQGNAVIAIKDGNTIAWSWQIWVTDWQIGTKEQVVGSGNPNLMPYAVGRCSAANYTYLERTVTIRFVQNVSGKTQDVTITQLPAVVSYGENAPYYQWGRKDPMVGTNGENSGEKPIFGNTPFVMSTSITPVAINMGILNPNVFYQSTEGSKNWMTPINATLWGYFTRTYTQDVKTIYDPCPIGYMVMTEPVLMPFVSLQYNFVTTPIMGCEFSSAGNGDYNLFFASYGARTADGGVIFNASQSGGTSDISMEGYKPRTSAGRASATNIKMGSYWSNLNFYWGNPDLFLDLLFPSAGGTERPYYQANNTASALSVCGVDEQAASTLSRASINGKSKWK